MTDSRIQSLSRARGLRLERSLSSAQFEDGRFRNLNPVTPGSPSLPVIGEYFFGGGERVPRAPLPLESPFERWATAPESGFRVTWLGHSTLLLEMGGLRILTDPVFGERASPFSFAGPRRFHAVPATIAQLPPIDFVLLSHDHYDHLCTTSVRELAKLGVPFVTSLGVGGRLEELGVQPELIHELDWHEHVTLSVPKGPTAPTHRGVRFTATPAQHFSGRGLTDRNSTLWSSWVIETQKHRIFFSGDTGLFPELADIGQKYGPFDLVLLEIGAFHPAWGTIHLGPENALRAHELLGGGLLMPVHWGTFNLAMHDWDEPGETLVRLADERGTRLFLPRLGGPSEPARAERTLPWWREVERAARGVELAGPGRALG